MAEPLESSVELSNTDALERVEELRAALEEALSSAVASVPPLIVETDASGVTPEVEEAVQGADATVPVDADTAEAAANVEDFEALAEGLDPLVPVDADTAAAQSELDEFASLADAVDPTVEVDADTTGAQAAIEELGSTATEASGGIDSATASTAGFDSAAGLATGNLGALQGAAGGLATKMPGVASGALAVGAGLGVLFTNAVDAQGAAYRFDTTLGGMAERVETIDVGSLNIGLDELALTLGSDDDALRNAAASLFVFAEGSGVGREAAADFAEQVIAVSGFAVAANPAIGSVGEVAERMSTQLGRGGPRLAKFGIELTASEIAARALQNRLPGVTGELSAQEKAIAGAQIAAERYGPAMQEKLGDAAENPIVQQGRLREEVNNLIEAAGAPIVAPVLETFEDAQPAIEASATSLGQLGASALPVVVSVLEALNPVLDIAVDLLDAIPAPATASAVAGGLLWRQWGPVAGVIGATLPILQSLSPALASGAVEVGTFALGGAQLARVMPGVSTGAGAAAGAVFGLGGAVGGTAGLMVQGAAAGGLLGSVIPGVGTAAGATIGAVVGLGAGLFGVGEDAEKATPKLDDFERAVNETGGAVQGQARDALAAVVANSALGSEMERVGLTLDDLIPVLQGDKAATESFASALGLTVPELRAMGFSSGEGVISLDDLTNRFGDASQAAERHAAIEGETSTALGEAQASFDEATQAASDYRGALDAVVGRNLDAAASQIGYEESLAGLRETVDEAVSGFGALGVGSTDVRSGFIETTRSAQDLAVALVTQLGPEGVAQANAGLASHYQSLVDLLSQYGITGQAATDFLASLGITPTFVDPATGSITGLTDTLGTVPGTAQDAAAGYTVAIGQISQATVAEMVKAKDAIVTNDPLISAAALATGSSAYVQYGTSFGQVDAATAQSMIAAGNQVVFARPGLDAASAGTGGQAAGAFGGAFDPASPVGRALGAASGTIVNAGFGFMSVDAVRAGQQVGAQFGNAVRVGIDASRGPVEDAGRRLIQAAIAGANTAGSPSEHLFFDLGVDLSAALAEGFGAARADVVAEAEAIVRAAANAGRVAGAMPGRGAGGLTLHVDGITVEVLGPVGSVEEARAIGDAIGEQLVLSTAHALDRHQADIEARML